MRFDYFTDVSETSLASVFSKQVLKAVKFYTACILFSSLLLWPRNQFSFFVENHETPIFFPSVYILTLFLMSHLSLRFGRGELSTVGYISGLLKKEIKTLDETLPFFTYGFINFLFFNALLTLILAPVLFIAASLSGIHVNLMLKSISILFIISFLSSLTGFIYYLIFGRWKITGYLLSRLTYGFILIGTAFISMNLNPVFQLYSIYKNQHQTPFLPLEPVSFYLIQLICTAAALSLISHLLIISKRRKVQGL